MRLLVIPHPNPGQREHRGAEVLLRRGEQLTDDVPEGSDDGADVSGGGVAVGDGSGGDAVFEEASGGVVCGAGVGAGLGADDDAGYE